MKILNENTGEYEKLRLKLSSDVPTGTVVDYEGTEVPKGWEKVDGIHPGVEYATNEYIDNQRIYKMIYKRLGIAPNLYGTYDLHIPLDKIIDITVYLRQGTQYYVPVPFLAADSQEFINYYIENSTLVIQCGKDRSQMEVICNITYVK